MFQAPWSASRRIVLCQLIALLTLGSSAAADGPPDRSLVDQLQKGGYVLYLRHFETNPDQEDTDPLHLENVAAQRQLTDAGRKQATDFGQALRRLAIPVGKVFCSQFHRAEESAKLIAAGDLVPTADVSASASAQSPEENKRRTQALRRLLTTAPEPGKNTLIVSHAPNLRDAAGAEFAGIGEGEVVVFHPGSDGTLRAVARVFPPSIWTQWAAQPR